MSWHRAGQIIRAKETETIMTAVELEKLIDEHIVGKKAYRNRHILKLYCIDGYTYEQIAEMVNMSPVQIGRIVRRYGNKVLLMLKK